MSDGTRDWRQGPPFPPPLIELLPAPGDVHAPAVPKVERPRYGLALFLFAMTFFCATTLGPVMLIFSRTDMMTLMPPFLLPGVVAEVWRTPGLLRMGLAFSIPALTILLAHELGHYAACRRYGLPCTLPYFLPVPFNFGTFGAFIKIKAPIYSKRQLFDVGIAGPIAGFVALIPFLLYGIAKSHPATLVPPAGAPDSLLLLPGHCLAIELAIWLFHGRLADGMVLDLHPAALGAWLGLFATALNLLPLGQLDGGHILYAATGRQQRRLALPLWLALVVLGFLWWGWFLWCLIVLLIGLYHPPVYDESIPLDLKRRLFAAFALVMFLLAFIPVPIRELAVR
ncbi:MAG TPA: site-2 protease family protein [Thermoanaerobaculia bacterium]|jgi:membrane-associated protease RseP (regulator of RpoE activity)